MGLSKRVKFFLPSAVKNRGHIGALATNLRYHRMTGAAARLWKSVKLAKCRNAVVLAFSGRGIQLSGGRDANTARSTPAPSLATRGVHGLAQQNLWRTR